MNPTKRFENKTYGIFRSILLILALTVCLSGCGKRLDVVDVEPFTVSYADRYIDLHLHLDGAVTVEIAKQLAELQNIKLPAADDEELKRLLTVPADCESLNDFLECFALPLSLMQTPEGLSEAVRLVAENVK